ncbi:MAG: hypothetical protein Q4F99_05755 [bacterium]|nr:hypothetical protein [bacterium]
MKPFRNAVNNKQASVPMMGTRQGIPSPLANGSKGNPRQKKVLRTFNLTFPCVQKLVFFFLPLALGCQSLSPHPSPATTTNPAPSILPSPALGETIKAPIPMTSILASMNYLDRLVWEDNTPVQWERIHSIKHAEPLPPPTTLWEKTKDFFGLRKVPGPILDCYRLSGPRHPEKKLWMNPYAKENYPLPPNGLKFR